MKDGGGGTGYVRFDIRITSCCPPVGGLTDDGRTKCVERGRSSGRKLIQSGLRWMGQGNDLLDCGETKVDHLDRMFFLVWIMLESHSFNESQLLLE